MAKAMPAQGRLARVPVHRGRRCRAMRQSIPRAAVGGDAGERGLRVTTTAALLGAVAAAGSALRPLTASAQEAQTPPQPSETEVAEASRSSGKSLRLGHNEGGKGNAQPSDSNKGKGGDGSKQGSSRKKRGKIREDLSYSRMWEWTQQGKIRRATLLSNRRAVLVETNDGTTYMVTLPYDPGLGKLFTRKGVIFDVERASLSRKMLEGFGAMFTPLVSIWILSRVFTRSLEVPGEEDMSQSLARQMDTKSIQTTLEDVAGIGDTRREVDEILHYLKNADLYTEFGAKVPRGVLLVGPPGTGKTLLAKAIAKEAGVNFMSTSGSEFSEMFVGVGASRVRQTFALARSSKPCIFFIDEFDALGEERSGSSGADLFGSDESANTINQLLTELDGFDDNSGVLILAATNRPQVLDRALTRPGRFDRVLTLPLPDLEGRIEILNVHARGKAIASDVDFHRVGRACAGMSGADIENLLNEAAISASRAEENEITEERIMANIEKVRRDSRMYTSEMAMTSIEEAVEDIDPKLREAVAAYCAGKALAATAMEEHDDVQKVTLFPDGRPLGFVTFLPLESNLDSTVVDPTYLKARLTVLLAGRAAEEELYGPENMSAMGTADLEEANFLARQMVMRYGINRRLGPVSLVTDTSTSYLQSDRQMERQRLQPMSDELQAAVLQEARELLEMAELRAREFLRQNRSALLALQSASLSSRSVLAKHLPDILANHSLTPPWQWPDNFVVSYSSSSDGDGDGSVATSPSS